MAPKSISEGEAFPTGPAVGSSPSSLPTFHSKMRLKKVKLGTFSEDDPFAFHALMYCREEGGLIELHSFGSKLTLQYRAEDLLKQGMAGVFILRAIDYGYNTLKVSSDVGAEE